MKHLQLGFQRSANAGMAIKIDKTSFLQEQVSFLGYIPSCSGISIDPDNIRTIQDFPVPNNRKHLRTFLGVCNYYRRVFSSV